MLTNTIDQQGISTARDEAADGLRGLACLVVTIFHFFCAFMPKLEHHIDPVTYPPDLSPSIWSRLLTTFPITLLHDGPFAVFIFFTLSGMVLSYPYYTSEAFSFIIIKRIRHRFFRLQFPVFIIIALTLLMSRADMFFNQQAAVKSGSTKWLSNQHMSDISLMNALSVGTYKAVLNGDTTLNTSLWTLRIEFYASIFLLVFLLVAVQRHNVFFSVASTFFLYATQSSDGIYFASLFSGHLIHRIRISRRVARVIMIAGTVIGSLPSIALVHGSAFTPYFSFLTLIEPKIYPAFGAFAVVTAVKNNSFDSVFTSRIALTLGRASYPLYLTHFVLLSSIFSYLYITFVFSPLAFTLLFVIYLCAIFLLAILLTIPPIATSQQRLMSFLYQCRFSFITTNR